MKLVRVPIEGKVPEAFCRSWEWLGPDSIHPFLLFVSQGQGHWIGFGRLRIHSQFCLLQPWDKLVGCALRPQYSHL